MASSNLSLEEQVRLLTARAEQAEARAEQEKTRAEQEKTRAEQEKTRAEQEKTRADQVKARAEEEKAELLRQMSPLTPSTFREFVLSMEENVFSAFAYERTAAKSASGAGTDVSGKMCPRFLRPWTDFTARHTASFDLLQASFGDQALFMSPAAVEVIRDDIIRSGPIANEMDVSSFIDHAIEKPAAAIVSAYFSLVQADTVRSVKFRSHAYGQLGEGSQKTSPSKDLMPDRWVYLDEEHNTLVISVGEYKPPHKLKAAMLEHIMSAPPSEQFFDEAIRLRSSDEQNVASPARVSGHVRVAQVLCQEYHYMIGAGCEYGYIASGDSLIFLRVLEDSPDVLYHHSVRLSVPANRDAEQRRQLNAGARNASETAVAYVASLCLWASETTPRHTEWITNVQEAAFRWPTQKQRKIDSQLVLHGRYSGGDRGGDGGGGGSGGSGWGTAGAGPPTLSRLPEQSGPLKRGHSPTRQPPPSGSGRQAATQPMEAAAATVPKTSETPMATRRSYIAEPPKLPYCTQACLGGLVRGLALDNNCPNVALHRAAYSKSGSNGNTTATASEAHALVHEGHPLTMATLQSQVLAQIAANMDKDIDCLDKYGCYGRYGVLFKIAVTGYGYTFVGKSVIEENVHVLAHEANVYESIPDLQGYLVPVFLGTIKLIRPIPRMCMLRTHMLLMSYVGPSLDFKKTRPDDVDLYAEAERTEWQLEQAGIYNKDVRDNNLAWNEEVHRVMHFDFDQVSLYTPSPEPDTPKVEPLATTLPDELTAPARSPLLTKTNWNASCLGNANGGSNENGHAAKRMRVDREAEEEEDVKHGLA